MKTITTIFLSLIFIITIHSQDFKARLIRTETNHFPYLSNAIQVYDSFNEPVTGLTNGNFAGSVDGKSVDSLTAATYKDAGLGFNIMLCLDLSGSMKGKPLVTTKNAILKFIDDMRAVDKLGLLGFADDAVLISDFSNDKDYLRDKVKSLQTSGTSTALYYGAYKGLNKLADNKEDIAKILILISDGKDESKSSSYTEDDVIGLANKEGIPVFSIGYSKIDKTYLQSLERISEKTGGNFYNSPTDSQLEQQYKKLYRQILNIYVVNYIAAGLNGDGAEHINVISVNDKGVTKTVSNKFIAPAGVKAFAEEKIIIKEDYSLYYYIAGGVLFLIIIAGLVFFFLNKQKKEKIEVEKKKKEEEHRKLDAEKAKREELERKIADAENPKNQQEVKDKNIPSSSFKNSSVREEKTIILNSSAPGLNLRLEVLTGDLSGTRFNVDSRGAAIGRSDDNSIVIKDSAVSSHHAKISFNNGRFFIEDVASSNGTFINGVQISSQELRHNDTFKFGKCEGNIQIFQ
ncbi:MAG: FHA domain-containing protein [Ignavibacteriaceae bacterium]|jgi:VWFA-related protein